MSRTSVLAQGFHDAWSHKWESFTPVIEGLTQAEAEWQHPSYADVAPDVGWPVNGTILWHIVHLIHCQERYSRVIRQWGKSVEARTADFETLKLEPLLERLESAHRDLLSCIESVQDAALLTETSGMTLQEFVLMCTRHDSWHAAQIAMVRRLYKHAHK